MWVKTNPNPEKKEVGDCVIRALAIALDMTWTEVYDDLYLLGREWHDMMSSNEVWGLYLYRHGFEPFMLPKTCPQCLTVKEFCKKYPHGTYIIGTGDHAVAVINGDYFDSWDSGNSVASYFWRVQ